MKKICCTCKEEKDLSEFNFKNIEKGVYSRECRLCHSVYNRKWYEKNTRERIDHVLQRKAELICKFREYKKILKCNNCGENHPATLDFHHRDGEKKDYNISSMANSGCAWERILEEIDKCDVLCSNCHRKFHWEFDNVALGLSG